MRKIIFVTVLLFVSTIVSAQKLNSYAENIKEKHPIEYENVIKKHALKEWGNDYSMVLFEINNQCKSFIEVLINVSEDEEVDIFFNSIIQWSYDGYEDINRKLLKSKDYHFIQLHCDWSMVKFEYNKQVKAKNAF